MPINAPVGVGGANVAGDVMYIQILLNDWRVRNKVEPITVDGVIGPETNAAIKTFEFRYTPARDGRIDPNGPTLQMLEQFHLDGVLSGQFSNTVRYNRRVHLQRDPATTKLLFALYLKTLRDKLT
jgi:peptidoglycan hydrolase-like protein with peptidoglycan-binding domain